MTVNECRLGMAQSHLHHKVLVTSYLTMMAISHHYHLIIAGHHIPLKRRSILRIPPILYRILSYSTVMTISHPYHSMLVIHHHPPRSRSILRL